MKGNLRVNRCFQFVWGTIQNCSFFKHLTSEWEPHRYDLLFKSPFVKIVLTSTFYRCMVDQRVLSRWRIYEWSLLAKISFNETKYPWTLFWAHETMRILRFELRRSLYPNVLALSVFRAKQQKRDKRGKLTCWVKLIHTQKKYFRQVHYPVLTRRDKTSQGLF